jgi:hypothetical protein
MQSTVTRPPTSTFLRRDPDDINQFAVIIEEHYAWLVDSWRPIRYVACPIHADHLAAVYGKRIADLADELGKGESMPLVISATCPDDSNVLDDVPNEGSTIISNAEAREVLREQGAESGGVS